MDDKDLIKKLNNLDLPDIEIKSHKDTLRMALISSGNFQRASFVGVFKKAFLVGAPAFGLLIFLAIVFIEPKITEARAIKIARQDPEVQRLMGENEISFKDVKIKDGKAYLLLKLPEEKQAGEKVKNDSGEMDSSEGAMIEVNLNQNKVNNIKAIKGEEFSPLNSEEKEEAGEIAANEESIREILPRQAKIEKVQTLLPKNLRLSDKDHRVEVVSDEDSPKRAKVHYSSDGKKWIIQVNLTEKKVEGVRYSESGE